MDNVMSDALDGLRDIVNDKTAKYKGVAGMEGFIDYMRETLVSVYGLDFVGDGIKDRDIVAALGSIYTTEQEYRDKAGLPVS